MYQKKRFFQPYFTVIDETWEQYNDDTKSYETVTKPVSYCYRSRDFVRCIKEDRNLAGTKTKIGLDRGKYSLKFVFSLFNPYSDDVTQDYILAVAHHVQETYGNLLKMMDLVDVDILDWDFFCSDLKVTMLVLGMFHLLIVMFVTYQRWSVRGRGTRGTAIQIL